MFLRVRRLDAIASFILSKAHFFQQETLSSSRHRRHTRRRWGRPIPPEPDTKKLFQNPQFSCLLVLSGSVVTSSATFHRKYQVPVQLCWEEQSCCPGCLLLPTFMFWQEHWYLPKGFFQYQLPVGVSTSGHFYLCWMLPLPSWNWPADAVAQPTCGRSSWKVKVKT